MKPIKQNITKIVVALFISVFSVSFQATAQEEDKGISIYTYRYVAPDKMGEYIERETKYWSKIAEKGMEQGNLRFWALFQKIGGFDIPNSSNILIINTFNDLNTARQGDIWNPSKVFPDVPLEQIETESLFTQKHFIFVKPEVFVSKEGAVPENDFNYVTMVYHNAKMPGRLIALEDKHWTPFIKSSMDKGTTTQKAWGNARILSPYAPNMKANTISFDIYSSLTEALDPTWTEDTEFPMDGLKEINDEEINERFAYTYRIVKVVQPKKE